MDQRIEKLFADYGKSFSASELRRVAGLYAETFIAAGPKGAMAQRRDDFVANADIAAEHYARVGQESAEIVSAQEAWFGDSYVMVTIRWGAHVKTLAERVEFDISYLVQLTDETPRIILFISHDDEQQVMRQLGLLAGAAVDKAGPAA